MCVCVYLSGKETFGRVMCVREWMDGWMAGVWGLCRDSYEDLMKQVRGL